MSKNKFDADELDDMKTVAVLTVAIALLIDKHMQKHRETGNKGKTKFFKERRDNAIFDLHWHVCFPIWEKSAIKADADKAKAEEVLKLISQKC